MLMGRAAAARRVCSLLADALLCPHTVCRAQDALREAARQHSSAAGLAIFSSRGSHAWRELRSPSAVHQVLGLRTWQPQAQLARRPAQPLLSQRWTCQGSAGRLHTHVRAEQQPCGLPALLRPQRWASSACASRAAAGAQARPRQQPGCLQAALLRPRRWTSSWGQPLQTAKAVVRESGPCLCSLLGNACACTRERKHHVAILSDIVHIHYETDSTCFMALAPL